MKKNIVAALAFLILIITLNSIIFDFLLNISYIRWYIGVGAIIGFASSFFGFIWDLDKTPDYISLNPFVYGATCLYLAGVSIYALGTFLQSRFRDDRTKAGQSGCLVAFINTISSLIFFSILVLIMMAWLVLVVPIQYFTFVICGAPAREFGRKNIRLMVKIFYLQLHVVVIDENDKVIEAPDLKSKILFATDAKSSPDGKIGEGWWDASPSGKPFTMTSFFSGLFFIALGYILDLIQTLS